VVVVLFLVVRLVDLEVLFVINVVVVVVFMLDLSLQIVLDLVVWVLVVEIFSDDDVSLAISIQVVKVVIIFVDDLKLVVVFRLALVIANAEDERAGIVADTVETLCKVDILVLNV
jgi:hypothetical protein